jgi:hypothetical protein
VQSTKLIPTLPNIAQISKKKSCGLKGNLRLHGDDKQKHKSKIIVVAIGAANTFQLMG